MEQWQLDSDWYKQGAQSRRGVTPAFLCIDCSSAATIILCRMTEIASLPSELPFTSAHVFLPLICHTT